MSPPGYLYLYKYKYMEALKLKSGLYNEAFIKNPLK